MDIDWQDACLQLQKADEVIRKIIDEVGECTLRPQVSAFEALTEAIVSQQLSTKAASTIYGRFKALLAGEISPTAILALDEEKLRAVGLSRQKSAYLRDLAAHWQNGLLQDKTLAEHDDESIIDELTKVKGIGRWTAEMFLIFSLCRPDVLAVDDLGLRKAIKIGYGLNELPGPDEMRQIAEPWRPFRSVASWYLWASLDKKPLPD